MMSSLQHNVKSHVARLREARIAYSILAGKDPNRDEKIY
jgi:hypothetical protein